MAKTEINHGNVRASVNGEKEIVGDRFPYYEIEHSDLRAKKLGDRYIIEIVDGNVVKAYAINVETLRRVNAKIEPLMINGFKVDWLNHAYWIIKQSGRYLGVIYDEWFEWSDRDRFVSLIKIRWFTCFDVNIIDGVFREIEIPPFGIIRKALLRCKDAI